MECCKDKIYYLIETLRRCKYKATAIHEILEQAWPEDCLSLRRIQEICKEIKDGKRTSLERIEGSGRPSTELRTTNIDEVSRLIEDDSCITTRHIASILGLSQSMVQRILCDDLGKIWLHTRWVPHVLSDHNKAVRVERCTDLIEALAFRLTRNNLITIDEKWFYLRQLQPRNVIGSWVTPGGDEERRKTARRTTMERKIMVIFALSQKGYHYYELLEVNEHVNSERYVEFLKNLETHLRNSLSPTLYENVRLIQDNARPHVSNYTNNFMMEKNIRLLKQPPYSPDCNLCDRYAFPRLEANRKGDFENSHDISQYLQQQVPLLTQNRMANALMELENDLQKIIENGGDYI